MTNMKDIAALLESDEIRFGHPIGVINDVVVYPIIGQFRTNLIHDNKDLDYAIADTESDNFIEMFSFEKQPIFFRMLSEISRDKEHRSPLHSFILEPMASHTIGVHRRRQKTMHFLDDVSVMFRELDGVLQILKFIDEVESRYFGFKLPHDYEMGYIASSERGFVAMEIIFDNSIWAYYRNDALSLLSHLNSYGNLDFDDILNIMWKMKTVRKKKIGSRQTLLSYTTSSHDSRLVANLLVYNKKPIHLFMRCKP